jgi:YVTN family beta-propeller protein
VHRSPSIVGLGLTIALLVTAGAGVRLEGGALDPWLSSAARAADDPTLVDGTPADSIGALLRSFYDEVASTINAAIAGRDELTATAPESKPAQKGDKQRKKWQKKPRQRARPSPQRRLSLVTTLTGGLTPKSVVSAQNGKVFAMNMMYGHTISVFNKRHKRVKVIDDSIDLAKFGYGQYPDKVQGAPAEGALNPRSGRLYVSNYSMYGPGFDDPGFDLCKSSDRIDRSFVYEINIETLRKTDAIRVGEVPKYLAVTPDGRYLVVGNWCSWDLSVVDLRQGEEIRRIPAGVAPRGIAFSPDSRTAYVSLVGGDRVLVIDMRTFTVTGEITGVGERPRHLVMSPNGRYLFITVEGEDKKKKLNGAVLKYDTRKRAIVAQSEPLVEPRTTVISKDGKSLYVVDYHPGTIVKLKCRDLSKIQTMYLGYHPIGVTYDKPTDKLWVAGYGGSIWVLKDR